MKTKVSIVYRSFHYHVVEKETGYTVYINSSWNECVKWCEANSWQVV